MKEGKDWWTNENGAAGGFVHIMEGWRGVARNRGNVKMNRPGTGYTDIARKYAAKPGTKWCP
jgi:hypothetical protein